MQLLLLGIVLVAYVVFLPVSDEQVLPLKENNGKNLDLFNTY